MDNPQKSLKAYSLEEVKEKLIDNKELFDLKLMIVLELEHIIKNAYRSKDPTMYCRNKMRNLINKIENGR